MDYSNGLFDCQSPTSPFLGGLRVLHLLEDLRGALELMDNEERDNLRCQIPDSTAEGLAEWLHGRLVNAAVCVCHVTGWVVRAGRCECDPVSVIDGRLTPAAPSHADDVVTLWWSEGYSSLRAL